MNQDNNYEEAGDSRYDYPIPDKPTVWQVFGPVALSLIFALGIWKLVEMLL